jgi:hypothetical protein
MLAIYSPNYIGPYHIICPNMNSSAYIEVYRDRPDYLPFNDISFPTDYSVLRVQEWTPAFPHPLLVVAFSPNIGFVECFEHHAVYRRYHRAYILIEACINGVIVENKNYIGDLTTKVLPTTWQELKGRRN